MATQYSSPDVAEVDELIAKATADHLSGPEWQLNITICDIANANHAMYVHHEEREALI